jgi:uncharacterized protein (TIGR02452 family)
MLGAVDDSTQNFRREQHADPKDHRHKSMYPRRRNSRELACWSHTWKYLHATPRFALDVAPCRHYFFSASSLPPAMLHQNEQSFSHLLVENTDTLTMARRFVGFGKGTTELTAILNMASGRRPGGNVRNGGRSQEADIARRSNLLLALDKRFYPLRQHAVLYSPQILVFKDAEYATCDEFSCAVITCAALRHPKLINGATYRPGQRTLMYQKVRAILDVAVLHDVSNLVLGAFGCGAFGNPPSQVAEIFRQLLIDECYAMHFSRVGFAVLAGNPHDQINLREFEKAFSRSRNLEK